LPPLLQKLVKIMEKAQGYELKERRRPQKGVLPFHIQHNTTPTIVKAVLNDPQNAIDRLSLSFATWDKSVKPFLRQLGILETDGSLSRWGERLRNLSAHEPTLLGDAVHGHLYTLHRFKPEVRFSFAYSVICDWLWEMREVLVDSRIVSQLVGFVVERSSVVYGIPSEEIAFSSKSVRGAFNWLKSLDPPVFDPTPSGKGWLFRRRRRCHPLAVLWAVTAWWQLNRLEIGKWVTWNSDLEDFLSRCLLLDDGCAKIAVEVAVGWQSWRSKILEAQTQGQFLTALRLNRVLGWGEMDF